MFGILVIQQTRVYPNLQESSAGEKVTAYLEHAYTEGFAEGTEESVGQEFHGAAILDEDASSLGNFSNNFRHVPDDHMSPCQSLQVRRVSRAPSPSRANHNITRTQLT